MDCQNELLSAVFEVQSGLVVVLDPDGRIVKFNKASARLTGYSAEEVIGKKIWDLFIIEAEKEGVINTFQDLQAKNFPIEYENYWLTKAGKMKLIAWSNNVILNEDGSIKYIVATGKDITEKNETIEEQELLLDTIDTQIWYLKDKSTYGKVNQAHADFLGVAKSDIENKKLDDFLGPQEAEIDKASNEQVFRQKKQIETEEWLANNKSEKRLLSITKNPKLDNRGEVEYVVCSAKDITEQQRIEDELKDVNDIIASSPVVLFKWEPDDWAVEFVSENINQFGYSQEQFNNREILFGDIVYEKDLAEVKNEVVEYSKRGTDRFKQHYRIVTAEGKERWVDDWTIIIRDDRGEINHYHGIIIDVTERVKAEQKIRDNEKRWKFALDSSQYGIWDWNLKEERVYFSSIWKQMLGYSSEEVTNDLNEWKDRVHPDDIDQAMWKIKEHLAGATEYYQDEHRMKHKDGQYIWIKDRGKVVEWTEGGDPLRFIGTHQDITEQKQIKEKLAKSEKRYRGLIESQQDLIVRVNKNNKFTYVNDSYCETFGKTKEELIGSSFTPLVHEDDIDDTLESMEELESPPYRTYFEHRAMTVDGWRWIAWEGYAIREEGRTVEVQGVGRDITELKEAKREAEAANRSKSEFLANMSHEIRTPLNAVIGFSELLEKMTDDSQQLDYLDSIKTAGNTLLTLINDILDLSKIEAGKLGINYEQFDLVVLIEEIEQIFRQKVHEKDLELKVDIPAESLVIELDETRLRQILLNLVGNAVKFTKEGYIKLAVNYQEEDNQELDLEIIVQDTGIGIAKGEQEDIFNVFKQQDGQSTREYGGTGLGLAITKRLTEMMDGELTLDSKPGVGSTFKLEFSAIEYQQESSANKEVKSESIDAIEFEPADILVVDDVEANRKLLEVILTNYSLEVSLAKTGKEAVEIATKNKFDLILMDLKMPEMDGYQAVNKIRQVKQNQSVPIVALTAAVTEAERNKVNSSEFSGFMSKPIDKLALIRGLTDYLEYSKASK
ncbi:MAG: PAS domain S-box protein [Bacillota bacterium]